MDDVLPDPLVTSTPERRGGQPVFAGTRVPVQTLFDYLAEDNGLADFLAEFPEISRAHVAAVLRTNTNPNAPGTNRHGRKNH
jgi:uncharacterized protein (DUF433 family)